jgi:hypothetical protein
LTLERARPDRVLGLCAQWARKSMVHCLLAGVAPPALAARDVVFNRLEAAGPHPGLGDGDEDTALVEGDDATDSWAQALQQLLARWI